MENVTQFTDWQGTTHTTIQIGQQIEISGTLTSDGVYEVLDTYHGEYVFKHIQTGVRCQWSFGTIQSGVENGIIKVIEVQRGAP